MRLRSAIAACLLAFGCIEAHGQTGGDLSPWAMTNFDVTETVESVTGAETTRVAVARNGDARIVVDITGGPVSKEPRRGTILLISGRWMATQDLSLESGSELDLMDIAALNSQLVMNLLRLALPEGPPKPGKPVQISLKEDHRPLQVGTSSGSGEYGAPWKVNGTACVAGPQAPVSYQLEFVFKTRDDEQDVHLAGQVSRTATPMEIVDSESLDGWKVYALGPRQETARAGTKMTFGAQLAPAAATVGELRRRK
jgi:hypothetical protein